MTYTITQKLQQAIPQIFGGGVRFRFVLVAMYPNGRREEKTVTAIQDDGSHRVEQIVKIHEPEPDNITSDLTVNEDTFITFQIGDKIKMNMVSDFHA